MLQRIQVGQQMELFSGVQLYVSQSDAARILGVTVRMIQYWESQKLLNPELPKQGRSRKYTQQDLIELRFIKCLVVDHGYSVPSLVDKLSSLEAPYYYDPDDIFWDLKAGMWKSRASIAREVWEGSKERLLEELEERLTENLSGTEMKERLVALFSVIPYVLEGRPFPKQRKSKSKKQSKGQSFIDYER